LSWEKKKLTKTFTIKKQGEGTSGKKKITRGCAKRVKCPGAKTKGDRGEQGGVRGLFLRKNNLGLNAETGAEDRKVNGKKKGQRLKRRQKANNDGNQTFRQEKGLLAVGWGTREFLLGAKRSTLTQKKRRDIGRKWPQGKRSRLQDEKKTGWWGGKT